MKQTTNPASTPVRSLRMALYLAWAKGYVSHRYSRIRGVLGICGRMRQYFEQNELDWKIKNCHYGWGAHVLSFFPEVMLFQKWLIEPGVGTHTIDRDPYWNMEREQDDEIRAFILLFAIELAKDAKS